MTRYKVSQSVSARLARLRRRMQAKIDTEHVQAFNLIARARREAFDKGFAGGYQTALFNYDMIIKGIKIAPIPSSSPEKIPFPSNRGGVLAGRQVSENDRRQKLSKG